MSSHSVPHRHRPRAAKAGAAPAPWPNGQSAQRGVAPTSLSGLTAEAGPPILPSEPAEGPPGLQPSGQEECTTQPLCAGQRPSVMLRRPSHPWPWPRRACSLNPLSRLIPVPSPRAVRINAFISVKDSSWNLDAVNVTMTTMSCQPSPQDQGTRQRWAPGGSLRRHGGVFCCTRGTKAQSLSRLPSPPLPGASTPSSRMVSSLAYSHTSSYS